MPRLDIPNSFTRLYTVPFLLSQSATIRAIAVRTGWQQSATSVGVYTFGGARNAVAGFDGTLEGEHRIFVFPNPSANGIFNIILPENQTEIAEYSLHGIDGKTLETGTAMSGAPSVIDLGRQPSGLYSLRIRMGHQVETRRLSRL